MRLLVTTLLLVACADPAKDTETAPPINQGDDTAVETCGGTAPVCSALTVEALEGLYDFEGTDSPVLRVGATGTDADSDMKTMGVELWWDDVVDGAVDTSAAGELLSYTFPDSGACSTTGNTLNVDFQVDGNRFEYETAYEFAGRVYDTTDLYSEIVIASGTTPNELGEAG